MIFMTIYSVFTPWWCKTAENRQENLRYSKREYTEEKGCILTLTTKQFEVVGPKVCQLQCSLFVLEIHPFLSALCDKDPVSSTAVSG